MLAFITCVQIITALITTDIQPGTATCQGTQCDFEYFQTTTDDLSVTLAQVLQRQLNIRILHDYQNCNSTNPSDNVSSNRPHLPRDCTEILSNGNSTSGVHMINPQEPTGIYNTTSTNPVFVHCDMDTDGGGWTVFQRRHNGLVGFFRNWEDYKHGFGYVDGDYWLGLRNLHWMTATARYELRVDLQDFSGNQAYAKYDGFQIADEKLAFMLILGAYQGDAGDSLSRHSYQKFSTNDRQHDTWQSGDCAQDRKGAWWYEACAQSNLNGLYKGPSQTSDDGMAWLYWKNNWEVLKVSEMKIRRIGQ